MFTTIFVCAILQRPMTRVIDVRQLSAVRLWLYTEYACFIHHNVADGQRIRNYDRKSTSQKMSSQWIGFRVCLRTMWFMISSQANGQDLSLCPFFQHSQIGYATLPPVIVHDFIVQFYFIGTWILSGPVLGLWCVLQQSNLNKSNSRTTCFFHFRFASRGSPHNRERRWRSGCKLLHRGQSSCSTTRLFVLLFIILERFSW